GRPRAARRYHLDRADLGYHAKQRVPHWHGRRSRNRRWTSESMGTLDGTNLLQALRQIRGNIGRVALLKKQACRHRLVPGRLPATLAVCSEVVHLGTFPTSCVLSGG